MSEQSTSGAARTGAPTPNPFPADDTPSVEAGGGRAATRPAVAVDTAPIDPSVVESLRILGARSGRDVLGELTVLYVSTADAQVETARSLLAAGDFGELARVAHALKGSSSVIGARHAAAAAADLEDSTGGGAASLATAEQALARFVAELDRFRAAIPGLRAPS